MIGNIFKKKKQLNLCFKKQNITHKLFKDYTDASKAMSKSYPALEGNKTSKQG